MRLHSTPTRSLAVLTSAAFTLTLTLMSSPAHSASNQAEFRAADGVMTYTAAPGAINNVTVSKDRFFSTIWIDDDGSRLLNGLPLRRVISSTMDCEARNENGSFVFGCSSDDVTKVVVKTRDTVDWVTVGMYSATGPGVRTNVDLGSGADVFRVVYTDSAREPNTIHGRGGADQILTGLGNDTLYGGYGADELHGQGGNDFLKGGPGNDLVYGENGDDYLSSRDTVKDSDFGGLGADRALADAIDLVYNAVRL